MSNTTAIPAIDLFATSPGTFLDERQLAGALLLSVKTLRNWRSEDIGPKPTKVAGSVRYRVGAVVAWIEETNQDE